jgi:hypothetical protein
LVRWGAGAVLALALLGLLRAKPWQRGTATDQAREAAERQRLAVGFLPVT